MMNPLDIAKKSLKFYAEYEGLWMVHIGGDEGANARIALDKIDIESGLNEKNESEAIKFVEEMADIRAKEWYPGSWPQLLDKFGRKARRIRNKWRKK